MEAIEIEVRIDRKVDVSVPLADLMESINEAPMIKRWNYIAQIMNGLQLSLNDTNPEQRELIKKYLTDKLALFSND